MLNLLLVALDVVVDTRLVLGEGGELAEDSAVLEAGHRELLGGVGRAALERDVGVVEEESGPRWVRRARGISEGRRMRDRGVYFGGGERGLFSQEHVHSPLLEVAHE